VSDTNEILRKVITTTSIGSTGLLNPQQSNRFIDYMWDQSVLAKEARVERLTAPVAELDKMAIGQRILRGANEAVDDHVNAGVTFSKISITTKKFRLDWELSTESLEDNLEGGGLEDHIARLMATQVGNDLEDLAINGDVSSADPLIGQLDGFRKLALASGHVVDAAGAAISKNIFNSALKAMPRFYKQKRQDLRFYTGSGLIQDWLFSLTTVDPTGIGIAGGLLARGIGPQGAPGGVYPMAFGIPIVEVPMFSETLAGTYTSPSGNHGTVELTMPNNRIWVVKRDITVYRQFMNKKDSIEYTVFLRAGIAVEEFDAYVICVNVKLQT
jgi:hypothetical protein